MLDARASAEWASISTSRIWISAIRCGSVAVSASAKSALRSLSAESTMEMRDSSVPGASCATWPMRACFGMVTEPPSAARSPVMMRKRVDLPAPLRPTRPAFTPAGSVTLAWSRSRRPAMRAERSVIVIMASFWPNCVTKARAGTPHRGSYEVGNEEAANGDKARDGSSFSGYKPILKACRNVLATQLREIAVAIVLREVPAITDDAVAGAAPGAKQGQFSLAEEFRGRCGAVHRGDAD
ncbi:hypothetical protein AGR2A_Cc100148 [Agrobacterium genomosp. 2 str. CFBP 5494]|uniref:Uncharacterized protein n=1 Tax=Agrobacterium genomosp. 2 str. CFBP 5494 TaxID=1183436 RepID=A0A9W5AYC7_9HYPH|nr:hypothetical protein AGR2A_Cc100148 [Agrobacterium genomosp. 2 str. CFBP 5494]